MENSRSMISIPSIVILPYLKTYNPVKYKNLVFKNIDDISNLSNELLIHIENIRNMFFLRDHLLIKQISYATLQRSDDIGWGNLDLLNQLYEFQIILAYIYSSPNPFSGEPFLTKEHANMYIFIPKKIS